MKIDRAMEWGGGLTSHACNCIGPQGGNPVCPCKMRGLKHVDGRWVEEIDHGPSGWNSKEWEEFEKSLK